MEIKLNRNVKSVVYNGDSAKVVQYRYKNENLEEVTQVVWREPYTFTITKNSGINKVYYKIESDINAVNWTYTTQTKTIDVGYGDRVYYYVTIASGYDNLNGEPTSESTSKSTLVVEDGMSISPNAVQYKTLTISEGVNSKVEVTRNGSKLENGSHIYSGDKLSVRCFIESSNYGKYKLMKSGDNATKVSPSTIGSVTYTDYYLATDPSKNTTYWILQRDESVATPLLVNRAVDITITNLSNLTITSKAVEVQWKNYNYSDEPTSEFKTSGTSKFDIANNRFKYYNYNFVKINGTFYYGSAVAGNSYYFEYETLEGCVEGCNAYYGGYLWELKILQDSVGSSELVLRRTQMSNTPGAYKSKVKITGFSIPE